MSVRLLIYFDQQMAKDVPAPVETEILNFSKFNDTEAQTDSSILCLSNETVYFENAIAESNSFASIGNMVNSITNYIVLGWFEMISSILLPDFCLSIVVDFVGIQQDCDVSLDVSGGESNISSVTEQYRDMKYLLRVSTCTISWW